MFNILLTDQYASDRPVGSVKNDSNLFDNNVRNVFNKKQKKKEKKKARRISIFKLFERRTVNKNITIERVEDPNRRTNIL